MDFGVRELEQRLSEHLRRIAGGEVIRITDRGHALLPEQPDDVATTVLAWLHERS